MAVLQPSPLLAQASLFEYRPGDRLSQIVNRQSSVALQRSRVGRVTVALGSASLRSAGSTESENRSAKYFGSRTPSFALTLCGTSIGGRPMEMVANNRLQVSDLTRRADLTAPLHPRNLQPATCHLLLFTRQVPHLLFRERIIVKGYYIKVLLISYLKDTFIFQKIQLIVDLFRVKIN